MKTDNQTTLSEKIKRLRLGKGYSQELLGQHAQLNLRTIQRIEKGESVPTGHSLNQLAAALGVNAGDLTRWELESNNGLVAFLSFLALSFFAFPLLGIVIPLGLWLFKKDEIKNMSEAGRRLINFQISWCILLALIFFYPLSGSANFFFEFMDTSIGGPEVKILGVLVSYGINFVYIFVNVIRSLTGKKVFYQPAIPFLKR